MGTIAQAYESGGQLAKQGVFSSLVTLAKVDGKVDETELALLNKIADRLSISPGVAKEIMKNPSEYPMIPPVNKEERFERLIQFIHMTFVDGVVDASEQNLVAKYGIALGFDDDDAHVYSETILRMIKEGENNDTILASLL